jgi:hypothetical protein
VKIAAAPTATKAEEHDAADQVCSSTATGWRTTRCTIVVSDPSPPARNLRNQQQTEQHRDAERDLSRAARANHGR